MNQTQVDDGTRFVLDVLLEEGIKPHAEAIARAHLNGEVAWIFFALEDEAASLWGTRGEPSECRVLSRTRAEKIAAELPPDDPAREWLRGRRPGRIFVFTGNGSLCIDYAQGLYRITPGTLDRDRMS